MKNLALSAALLCAVSAFATSCGNSKVDTVMPTEAPKQKPTIKASLPKVEDFALTAQKFGYRLELPVFEQSPAEVKNSVEKSLQNAEVALAAISARKVGAMTFENTVRALDDALFEPYNLAGRLDLIKETSTDPEVRNAAEESMIQIKQWFTSLDYREDLSNAISQFAKLNPDLLAVRGDLTTEDLQYMNDSLRTYRRSGMSLPVEKRKQVESLRKKIDELTTKFQSNITEDKTAVTFTKDELAGVSEDDIAQYKFDAATGLYSVIAKSPAQALPILENAKVEESRKRMMTARYSVAAAVNGPILHETLNIRDQIAQLLGYASWADYQIEPKMAKTYATAEKFIADVAKGLEPKMKAEVAEMLAMKSKDTANPNAEFKMWDYYYYMNQLQKEKYNVDKSVLDVFFPSDQVLAGMMRIYSSMFRLKFTEVDPGFKWIGDLRLFLAEDSLTGEPLGLIYFDLYPREGKYNHFAQFGITSGKRLPDGTYQRPVVAVVCNFPPPTANVPSLLSFDDVETMFHEFGHAMHSVLTQANYSSYSGTSVQADFVEAPSQMLENWVLQKQVTDIISGDYRDPSKKIDAETLEKIRQAKNGVAGVYNRRQMALALTDLRIHQAGQNKDHVQITNETFSEVFVALPETSDFDSSWGHIMGGYDAGYYGYAWSEVISVDMFTPFKANPKGFLDQTLGMRLRKEIYSVGGSKPADEAVRAFLGRPYSFKPYLAQFGIELP